jgi:hypothetical protein
VSCCLHVTQQHTTAQAMHAALLLLLAAPLAASLLLD